MEVSMASRKSPVSDVNLIPRVKQYLEENVHKTYVDVDEMTASLMGRYGEYSRRKIIPFKILVEHAYKTVLHSYGLDSNPGSDEDVGSDLEVMDDANGKGNHLSNALTSMYLKKSANPVSSTEDAAAAISIDISSDEEDSGKNQDSSQQSFDKLKQVTIKSVSSSTPAVAAPSANGTKASEAQINDLMGKMRPGPASQKKRRLEAMEESMVPSPKQQQTQPTSQQPSAQQKTPKKKFKKEVFAKFPASTFEDVGGMDKTLKELCELILHIKHPEMYKHIGLPPPRGFLLHGPPGSGKTLLAHSIAGQLDVLLVEVQATELIAGVSGESEERIREIFEQAATFAPCVLFIDEIDAISSNRQNAQKDMERRIVAQLIASLDSLSKFRFGDQVLVIGATNRPEALDPALRRVGRFDHEISLGIPDRTARCQILNIISRNLKLERPFDYDEIATLTPGYVGADLLALATRAASTAIKRVMTEKERVALENSLKPVPIVNLDDDAILMEVDETKKNEKVEEEKEPETGETEAPEVKEVKEAEVEIEKTEVTTATEPEISAVDPPAEEVQPVPTPEETPMEVEEPAKQGDAVNQVENMLPEKKLQLTLSNMIKWLASDIQPMTEQELEKLSITREDFLDAVKHVQPSAKREGFITVPDVTWDDIGSLQDIRNELKLAILAPVKFPEKMLKLGLQSPSGVLLCGPPGCGKTLLAKAVANEAGINFISVKGPELLNMYVGESERAVRQCFQRARNSTPCVIFFDEFDSLCPKRSDTGENSSQRVVNQLLTEMDGIEDRNGVFLMAATNRPDIVDPAVLRPGRLDKILYVGLPEHDDRVDILKAVTKNGSKPELGSDVDFSEIADLTKGYTGADLAGLVRQASLQTLKESIDRDSDSIDDLKVCKNHFLDAIKKLKPSVGEQDIKNYAKLKEKYGFQKD